MHYALAADVRLYPFADGKKAFAIKQDLPAAFVLDAQSHSIIRLLGDFDYAELLDLIADAGASADERGEILAKLEAICCRLAELRILVEVGNA